jgi:hypothetical protein
MPYSSMAATPEEYSTSSGIPRFLTLNFPVVLLIMRKDCALIITIVLHI